MARSSEKPLARRRVVVTRAREQSPELSRLLREQGAEIVELPLLEITPAVDKQVLADVMLEFGGYDWIVFTSANGVRYFFEEYFKLFDDIRSLGLLRFAAVGETTAAAIREFRLRVECQPKVATAEALADELIATGSLDNAKILVITGNLNREVLTQKLEEARAIVDQLQVYQTTKKDLSKDPATADFRAHGADAVLFASSSAVQSFVDQAATLKLAPQAKRPLAGSIGPQTSATMKQVGMGVDFEAKEPSLAGLVAALVKRLAS